MSAADGADNSAQQNFTPFILSLCPGIGDPAPLQSASIWCQNCLKKPQFRSISTPFCTKLPQRGSFSRDHGLPDQLGPELRLPIAAGAGYVAERLVADV